MNIFIQVYKNLLLKKGGKGFRKFNQRLFRWYWQVMIVLLKPQQPGEKPKPYYFLF
jgi:hypothetical protein